MAYVPVKGGEAAILNALDLVAEERRGDPADPELTLAQIRTQQARAVDRVMAEGSLYDPDLAALALKQAQGDATEAAFLLRAYRTTLEQFARARPLETDRMAIRRRISACYKDLPGGQVLGPSVDYSHRMLDFDLAGEGAPTAPRAEAPVAAQMPRVPDLVGNEGFMEPSEPPAGDPAPGDLTRDPLAFPAPRDIRLQNLARADEGFLLGLAYSTQRGFGSNHPYAGEIRMGEVPVEVVPEELGFAIEIGEVTLTESQMITSVKGASGENPKFTRGYGLAFGHCERKAMSMALVDRALRADEFAEEPRYPAQDAEFVLYHSDNVESSGFVQHLKLPHYVDFQAELRMLREMRAARRATEQEAAE
ncbi:alpha-D-ribose 1-methylphosphonate 5-triphosphate synthase subunit PhnI [Rhodovulum iodosum]|uniref:Alpha-D-ribose 1-methylphosphonate 5-triphosphate synthase subunit PhnI n=1 Tax=Rhodovulum iodosum TaxID=68291 RepID=A0ABV3XQK3_9RHOB|nr:carbon-phosphorus lyase complex subunit PhnI [Rhodovulum robiginosum]RSK35801.1 carbon-phosphorus lyase complex subunit PhnI [Rhodovulum robiginosum]